VPRMMPPISKYKITSLLLPLGHNSNTTMIMDAFYKHQRVAPIQTRPAPLGDAIALPTSF
jgi:hypothetical protein